MITYGRQTIYANYTENDLISSNEDTLQKIVLDILINAIPIHEANHVQTIYLNGYLYGLQDIYAEKKKLTRPEINNKCVENWAYAIVDFKKTYLLGKPIQYTQLNDTSEKEISALNKYVRYANKKAKDMILFQDVLACGRGYRYINKDTSKDDEAPFEIINCPVEDTEVVYSSRLGHEQLLEFIKTSMQFIRTTVDSTTGQEKQEIVPYNEYTIYLRNYTMVINDKGGVLQVVANSIKPLMLGLHIINEYYLNEKRISLIELGKDLFNDINYLESMDKDDMEQFVNAIMVFTNCEVGGDDLVDIRNMGAVCINSTDQKKASVELLQNRLSATDTQTYYNRLLNALHQILGVPMASDNGSVTYGDTGTAKLTGQGFTSAGIRAEGDETMFGMCDLNTLKVILKICKESTQSEIKTLKASDIDIKFQRDMSDNLLTKSQALLSLYQADIPRKYANAIVNLFGDSNAVTNEQEKLFGEQVSQQSAKKTTDAQNPTTNDKDKANEQNNKIKNTLQNQNQGQ